MKISVILLISVLMTTGPVVKTNHRLSRSATGGLLVTLDGSGSYDPDGTIVAYKWRQISGPNQSVITDDSKAVTTAAPLVWIVGVYTFELKITDNGGATASDQMTVTIIAGVNTPPMAYAGADKTIQLPTNTVDMTGAASDPGGAVALINWTKISGPAVTIQFPQITSARMIGLTEGVYEFEMRVTDNGGAVAADRVKVTVKGKSCSFWEKLFRRNGCRF